MTIEIIRAYLRGGEQIFNHPLVKTFMENRNKISKSEAGYRQAFVGETPCWVCQNLESGMNCRLVVGTVQRDFTCDDAVHVLKLRKEKK